MKNKQTAVEWLIEQIYPTISETLDDVCIEQLIEISKAMEKVQIVEAIDYGCSDWGSFKDVEKYYKDTYINEDDFYVPFPEPNEALKSAKEKYDKQPRVSDDFQIGPDGAYEHNSDWDATLMDGLEYESWDEVYDDYAGESDLHEFVKWLKENFHVPIKL